MPSYEGPLGLPRVTGIGPLVKSEKQAEWERLMEQSDRNLETLGFEQNE